MNKYKRTLVAGFIAYVTQAIIINVAPLLFVLFQKEFSLSVSQIGILVTYSFCAQILVDILAARYAERIGIKVCIVAAHVLSAFGLIGMGLFPTLLSDAYAGLFLATTVYSVGAGLIEVMTSSIVEALPFDGKSGVMSFLHSFYCWGHALVVILSTAFFYFFGTENWRVLVALWAVVPLTNAVLFAVSPVRVNSEAGEKPSIRKLLGTRIFWVFALLMICAGAAEQAMAQWTSFFAEKGLNISKTMGDLLGGCSFAILMGSARAGYAALSKKISLRTVILCSSLLCVISYLLAVFAPHPVLSLVGCALCGLSVGVLWPGTLSLSTNHYPAGGTAMFGLLAFAGDIGCASGPAVVGFLGDFTGNLKSGLLAAIIFPVLMIIGVLLLRRDNKK